MKINLVGQSYEGRSKDAGYISCLNLYPERIETDDGTEPSILIGCPGQSNVDSWDLTNVPGWSTRKPRGTYTASWNSIYTLWENQLVRYDSESSIPTILGVIGSPGINTPVTMIDNGTSLVIVDGYGLYAVERVGNAITKVDIGTRTPTHICFLAGYFVINNTYLDPAQTKPPSNTKLFFSEVYDAYTWPASNFVTAEGSADPLISLKVINDQVWAQGVQRFQIFTPTGTYPTIFEKLTGSLTFTGIIAPFSSCTMGNTLFWIGVNVTGGITAYRSKNLSPERISTHSEEYQWSDITSASDIQGWVYSKEGHDFVIFTSQALNLTLVWDDAEQRWHRRSKHNYVRTGEDAYEAIYATSLGGESYCMCASQPKVLKLDLDKYDDWDGDVIVREHSLPIIKDELMGIVHDKFSLHMETGYGSGDPASLAYKPQATLYQSDDGGHTWTTGVDASIGESGEFGRRVTWWRRGVARFRQYRIRISAPVKQVWIAAFVESTSLKNKR